MRPRTTAGATPTPTDAFAWLLAPLRIADFDTRYHERALCHLARADASYYDRLLTVRDLDTVIGTHVVTYPDISLVRGEDDVPRRAYTDDAGRIDPLGVARLFDEGATVVFRHLHRRVPALARLCDAVGASVGSRVQTNVYLTPPRAQGFRPHWDTHDVFVLQVAGRKAWSTYDTKIALPLAGQRFDPARDEPGPVTARFDLGPGDLVYVPRGLMHAARSTSDTSLHITLGLLAITWTDYLLESVAAAALDDVALRRHLPRGFTRPDYPPAERARLGREQLDRVLQRVAAGEVAQRFHDEVAGVNRPLFTDLLTARLDPEPIALDTTVRRRDGLRPTVVGDDGAGVCGLRFAGHEVRLPARVRPAVEFAASADRWRVRELPGCLDAEGKLTLVRRLIRDGLLQRSRD